MSNSEELQRQVSQEKLENLLRVHGEENSLDFKQYFSPSSQRARAELVRDILAFANTEGGGHMVFGVVDKTYEPVGLPANVHFDTTTISNALNKYITAHIRLMAAEYEVERPTWPEKRRFGILYIAEYPEIVTPRSDIAYEDEKKKTIALARSGDILVRLGAQSIRADQASLERLIRRKRHNMESSENQKGLLQEEAKNKYSKSTSPFETYFKHYLSQAQNARDQNQHHDHRRQLFLAFLKDAFSIEPADVEVEKYIKIANQQVPIRGAVRIRKGWIDAVFHDLIFEFKRDLKKEEADGLRELRDYLSTISNGFECIGLLTDGLIFTAYVLDPGHKVGLRPIDSINLETASPNVAYLWLDAYLLRQSNVPPTSADIVRRFGLNSPTFVTTARTLREALKIFGDSEAGALEVKRQQWAFHLARVYGSADVGNDEMFVRHTYLCQFAKILAYAARFGVGETTQRIEGIINGRAFEILGVNNIGEQDFFAWVLAPEVRHLTLGVFNHIAASLVVYDLHSIDEDLLKQLYQNLVEPETRHELGEFYTPDWLAELTLREIGYQPKQSLLAKSTVFHPLREANVRYTSCIQEDI